MGDSYISGEGGRWAGNSNVAYSLVDALGSDAYYDNPTRTGELIPLCHRSWSAEVLIGFTPNGEGANGKTLACSGALSYTTFSLFGDFKPGLDFYSQGTYKGQAQMLYEFAKTHNVKLVPLSIGGNNFNFATIIEDCVGFYEVGLNCSGYSGVTNNFLPANVQQQTIAMTTGILNIRSAMRYAGYNDADYTILVQNYETPIPTSSNFRYPASGTDRTAKGGCEIGNTDADWARGTALPTINKAVVDAAGKAGLPNVRLLDLSAAFDGHALCAKGVDLIPQAGVPDYKAAGAVDTSEWINQIRIGTGFGPYFQQESLHPNYWGQLALRSCIRQAFRNGQPVGGVCKIAGKGLDGRNEPRMILGRQLSTATTRSAGVGNARRGTPSTALCPPYAVLTGATLHIDGSVVGVRGTCRPLHVTASSVSLGTATATTRRIGRTGSQVAAATCPARHVVTGLHGRSGRTVGGIRLRCSPLKVDGTPGATARTVPLVGGGSATLPRKSCSGAMAVGLRGRVGNGLHHLALTCSRLR